MGSCLIGLQIGQTTVQQVGPLLKYMVIQGGWALKGDIEIPATLLTMLIHVY